MSVQFFIVASVTAALLSILPALTALIQEVWVQFTPLIIRPWIALTGPILHYQRNKAMFNPIGVLYMDVLYQTPTGCWRQNHLIRERCYAEILRHYNILKNRSNVIIRLTSSNRMKSSSIEALLITGTRLCVSWDQAEIGCELGPGWNLVWAGTRLRLGVSRDQAEIGFTWFIWSDYRCHCYFTSQKMIRHSLTVLVTTYIYVLFQNECVFYLLSQSFRSFIINEQSLIWIQVSIIFLFLLHCETVLIQVMLLFMVYVLLVLGLHDESEWSWTNGMDIIFVFFKLELIYSIFKSYWILL